MRKVVVGWIGKAGGEGYKAGDGERRRDGRVRARRVFSLGIHSELCGPARVSRQDFESREIILGWRKRVSRNPQTQ